MTRIGGGKSAALFAVLACAVLLAGCAALPEPLGNPFYVEAGPASAQALDPHRVRFAFDVTTVNQGKRRLEGLVASCSLRLDGTAAASAGPLRTYALDPGESRKDAFELTVDLRDLASAPGDAESADLSWELVAEIRAGGSDAMLGAASAHGSFPRIREPELAVQSIILVKHELINVLLDLVLDIKNPNSFPVEFDSISYQFFGEGTKWSNGGVERPVQIPARGTARVRLPIILNFTEMGRVLFDLVAKLQEVRYRLAGEARVTSPLSFLPAFRMKFDETGAVRVERTLSPGR